MIRMIITEQFVFLHLPKTGGTFVRSVLEKVARRPGDLFLDDRTLPKHGGISCIPVLYRDRPILSAVRNPFDHLVSFFEFEWWKTHPADIFDLTKMLRKYPHFPDIDFETYIRSIYDWELLDSAYASDSVKQAFERTNLGSLTFDYINFFASEPETEFSNFDYFDIPHMKEIMSDITLLRTDTLNEDLYRFLQRMGFAAAEIEYIKSLPRIFPDGGNRNQERHWREYYSNVLEDVVREKERLLFGALPEFDVDSIRKAPFFVAPEVAAD